MAIENSLARPNALAVLGSPVDLGSVAHDAYIVAGLQDHLVPWENAYRSALLLGGETRFVLSTSGHIQALVNPPSPESRASYSAGGSLPAAPEEWQDGAVASRGSWWPDWTAWLGERSGGHKAAPTRLGSRAHRAAGKAPGSYVHAA
jgi:polyhydroxyalkanoate synthase